MYESLPGTWDSGAYCYNGVVILWKVALWFSVFADTMYLFTAMAKCSSYRGKTNIRVCFFYIENIYLRKGFN